MTNARAQAPARVEAVAPADGRTDAALLRAAGRDPAAFRELYDRHSEALYRFHLSRTHDHHGALDLTAETFAQAWASRGRFVDQRSGSAKPWLFGIARNVLLSSVRRQRLADGACRRLGMQRDTAPLEPDASWIDGLDEDVEAALADLPADQREAIELRVISDQSYETIAELQDCAPATARVRVFRGLRSVRSTVKGSDHE